MTARLSRLWYSKPKPRPKTLDSSRDAIGICDADASVPYAAAREVEPRGSESPPESSLKQGTA